jgi:hypothetical protein
MDSAAAILFVALAVYAAAGLAIGLAFVIHGVGWLRAAAVYR